MEVLRGNKGPPPTVMVNKSPKIYAENRYIYLRAIYITDFFFKFIISVLVHYLKTKPIWQAIRTALHVKILCFDVVSEIVSATGNRNRRALDG